MKEAIILCVDDEYIVLKSLKRELSEELGNAYLIETADSGAGALELLQQLLSEGYEIPVVIADYLMPGMKGDVLLSYMHTMSPKTLTIMLTGQANIEAVIKAINSAHLYRYIAKPWERTDLSLTVKDAIARYFQDQKLEEQHAILQTLYAQAQQEITERKRVEQALRKSEERYRIVLESAPDPVVVYDLEQHITYVNPGFSRVFGWTLREIQEREHELFPIEVLSESESIFNRLNRGETISGIETYRLTKAGKRVEVSVSGAGFFDDQGHLQGSILTFQDITIRKQTEQEIRFLAYHDMLTGLPNRKSFYMRMEDELLQASHKVENERRRAGHAKWAILFLDLDRFKSINDTLGHDVGDELLKMVADRLQRCLRKNDYIFRLGGDEFTIILNDLTQDTDIARVVCKIREYIAWPCHIKNRELYVTASIGISVYPDDGDTVEKLVKNADMAVYAAKTETEGYRFFTEEMNRQAMERMEMESSLRNAIQQNQFVIYYQPLVDDQSRIIGMEALIRWLHPDLGLILPSQFIPLAEQTGAIIPIGKWVLHSACQQAKKWNEMGYPKFYVAVNISARQLKEPNLAEIVEQVLEVTGLDPHCLKLEVTESGIMENPDLAITQMKVLRARGVHFAIDDFGTGYSSLSYLKRLPIDTLKIDRSFVTDAATSKDDQEIIKTIISVAHNLNIDAVAEGVETKEQKDFLSLYGCTMMQGYYFGRPMPADKFETILLTQHQ